MFKRTLTTFALAAVTAAGAVAAQPHHGGSNDTSCFFINQWNGWSAPNDRTLYLGVNYRDVYEVQLADSSPFLQNPEAHIVSDTRAPTRSATPWTCSWRSTNPTASTSG